jgi:hypothetical protein
MGISKRGEPRMPSHFSPRADRKTTIEAAKRHFVARVSAEIFQEAFSAPLPTFKRAFAAVLGKRYQSARSSLEAYIEPGFEGTLQAVEAFYTAYQMRFPADLAGLEALNVQIRALLEEAAVDVGVRWDHGHFAPSGATFLDESLVDEVLIALHEPQYEAVLEPYRRGLTQFRHAEHSPAVLADVVTNMSTAFAALVGEIMEADLSTHPELLLNKVPVSASYKNVLRAYITYANECRQMAQGEHPQRCFSLPEVESFIYLTGMVIRLVLTTAR